MKTRVANLLALVLLAFVGTALAATPGTDNANQSVYDDAWNEPDDGAATGDGFGQWFLTTSATGTGVAGFFIGDSRNVASGSGANINVNNESFGMFASSGTNGNASANAFRFFNGNLSTGDTFSLDLALNFTDNKGFNLRRTGDDATIFNLNIANGYFIGVGNVSNNFTNANYDSNTAFHLSFTQTDNSGGTWNITRSGGISDSANGTYSGIAASFQLYTFDTGGGSQNDLMANNMSVVPEPGTFVFLGAGGVALLLFRRRRS